MGNASQFRSVGISADEEIVERFPTHPGLEIRVKPAQFLTPLLPRCADYFPILNERELRVLCNIILFKQCAYD